MAPREIFDSETETKMTLPVIPKYIGSHNTRYLETSETPIYGHELSLVQFFWGGFFRAYAYQHAYELWLFDPTIDIYLTCLVTVESK